ncbi:heavy metal translocating P-type ATPase [Lampropedia puyangensis]|nr:cation-translocating P-type ATPase [Lampropedia puyangensis]
MNQTKHQHEVHDHSGSAHHAEAKEGHDIHSATSKPSACGGCCTAPIVQFGRSNGNDHDHEHADEEGDHADHDHGSLAPWWRVALALALGLMAELTHQFLGDAGAAKAAGMGLAAVAIVLSGFGIYQSGIKALLRGQLNILALMAVAVTGAFLIGQWAEAAMVMALFVAAEKLEDAAMDRARNAVRDLMVTMPQSVLRVLTDGRTEQVAVAAVQLGDQVRVAPGERVALDGEVISGQSAVNQAPITGESTPVDKKPGELLFAGSINTTGVLLMRITGAVGTTLLDRIVDMVERSQQAKALIQRTVDRFAAIYTPIVMVLALLVALGLPLLFGWTWMDAIYRALALLVIACPCALVIATPVAIVSALGNAAKQGVLFKGGQALEKAQKIRTIAFDKTGTLTEGKPQLEEWSVLPGTDDGEAKQVQALAQALATRSKHPVSKAIAQGLEEDAPSVAYAQADAYTQMDMEEKPGSGVQAHWQGKLWRLGGLHWLLQEGVQTLSTEAMAQVQAWRAKGFSVTALSSDVRIAALFAVTDTVRSEASAVVQMLQNEGMQTAMLSGDSPEAAQHMGERIGIAFAQGGLLPQDKLNAIAAYNQQTPTAMIGDGINDAPALAQASLGIAMGGAEGTDIATETADVVLMSGNLQGLPGVFRLARKTHAVVWQNIALALAGKAVFLALAVAGMATMWMAVVADLGISLLVVANGMRLRRDAASRPVQSIEGPTVSHRV